MVKHIAAPICTRSLSTRIVQPVSEEPSLVKGGQIACFAASAPVHFLKLPVSYCTWFQETSKWPQISRTTVDRQNASLVGTSKLVDRALPTQLFFSKAAAGTSFGLRADLMFKRVRKKKKGKTKGFSNGPPTSYVLHPTDAVSRSCVCVFWTPKTVGCCFGFSVDWK